MQVAHGWTGVEFGMAVHARAGRCEFGCEIRFETAVSRACSLRFSRFPPGVWCGSCIKDGGYVPATDLMPLQQLSTKVSAGKKKACGMIPGQKGLIYIITLHFFGEGASHLGRFVSIRI